MTGFSTEIAMHKLSLDPNVPPVRKKKCLIVEARNKFVKEEVYRIFDTKEERMQQYVVKVQALLERFREWSITHIPREDNAEMDALANLGSLTEIKGSKSGMVVQLMSSVLDTDGYYEIKRITYSPYHPSANGQAESTNKVIIQNLKKRLEAAKGKWPKELPGVLWAYRTTVKSSTRETSFSLVYGAEALILVEVGEPTLRHFWADEESNNEAMLINLELLEERKDLAHVRTVAQKQRMKGYYNQRDNFCYFKVGYLVLRKVTQNTRELNAAKLGPTWEGPYRISAITGKGSNEWENQNGDKLPSKWNVAHLKRYYF
ncbi:uncharacterized protein [Nicotiana tomentosiformis]|uniref:uncharacterized protein n=1 Tax=Nicotiana tomentosiformis TaxID=4098 RepID=UPI00388C4662